MSEPVPCPSCGVLLRLPEGAVRLRCPGCQSILELDLPEVPPPIAMAIPLPFENPPVAKPLPAEPARSKPVPAGKATPTEDATSPYAAPSQLSDEEREAARAEEVRKQLLELEKQEDRRKEAYEVLTEQAAKARLGLHFLRFGCLTALFTALASIGFFIGSLTGVAVGLVLFLVAGLLGLHGVLCLAGFGLCVAGPTRMRGMAIGGLLATLFQMVLAVLAAIIGLAAVVVARVAERDDHAMYLFTNLVLSNAMCNLTVVADLPFYMQQDLRPKPVAILLLVVAAMLEFAKISTLGLLVNQYANEAKDADLAFSGMRFVYRIFAILLLAPIIKGLITAFVVMSIAWIPLLLGTIGFNLWCAFAWFAQYQVITDLIEIVTASRFTDKRRRIDTI